MASPIIDSIDATPDPVLIDEGVLVTSSARVIEPGIAIATVTITDSQGNEASAQHTFEVEQPWDISGDVSMASLYVAPGGEFAFNPAADTTLHITDASVLVEGILRMRPNPGVKHRLVFEGIDEAAFVGGGMGPMGPTDPILSSDRGLYVMGGGRLDIAGAPKTEWTRLAGSALSGASSLILEAAPSGWEVGDEIVVVPTAANNHPDAYSFDVRTITSLNGAQVGLDSPLSFNHPAVVAPFKTWTAEVLNLTRSVSIDGTASGRAHIFLHPDGPITVSHVSSRYTGPRKDDGSNRGKAVLGRWPWHFHHVHHAAHGSNLEGLVVRNAGGHAFVAHATHGVTWNRCIAYDVIETPLWWDKDVPEDASDDVSYLGCVAAKIAWGDQDKKGKNGGFLATAGTGNVANDCVVIAAEASADRNGFRWDNIPNSANWEFRRNLVHNIRLGTGLFMWQNPAEPSPIEDFESYHCERSIAEHGAYGNGYQFLRTKGWGSLLLIKAGSAAGGLHLVHEDMNIGGGVYGIEFGHHNNEPTRFAYIIRPHIWDVTTKAIHLNEPGTGQPGWYRFIEPKVHEGANVRELQASDCQITGMKSNSLYEFKHQDGTCWKLLPDGTSVEIPPFDGP